MDELITALNATELSFAHYGWSHAPDGDYGIYAEEGANDLIAGNTHVETVIRLTVDYFTRDDTQTPKTTIEAALNSIFCAWYLNSVQYESESGYIHYEWVVEVGDDRTEGN